MKENIKINFSVFGKNRRKDEKSQKENKKGIKNLILSRYHPLPRTPLQSSIDLTSPNSNKCNPHLSRSKRLKMYVKKKKKKKYVFFKFIFNGSVCFEGGKDFLHLDRELAGEMVIGTNQPAIHPFIHSSTHPTSQK